MYVESASLHPKPHSRLAWIAGFFDPLNFYGDKTIRQKKKLREGECSPFYPLGLLFSTRATTAYLLTQSCVAWYDSTSRAEALQGGHARGGRRPCRGNVPPASGYDRRGTGHHTLSAGL